LIEVADGVADVSGLGSRRSGSCDSRARALRCAREWPLCMPSPTMQSTFSLSPLSPLFFSFFIILPPAREKSPQDSFLATQCSAAPLAASCFQISHYTVLDGSWPCSWQTPGWREYKLEAGRAKFGDRDTLITSSSSDHITSGSTHMCRNCQPGLPLRCHRRHRRHRRQPQPEPPLGPPCRRRCNRRPAGRR